MSEPPPQPFVGEPIGPVWKELKEACKPALRKFKFGMVALAVGSCVAANVLYFRNVLSPVYHELVRGVNENEGATRLVGTDVSLKLASLRFQKLGVGNDKDVRGYVDVVGSRGRPMRLNFEVDQSANPGTWAASSLVLFDHRDGPEPTPNGHRLV
eukprot:TRINITY_DN33377_c0_g1_i1.p1 TRINITY_DN33377_c0_g1~~TRINITY_DN33377_c0_g1_i1.p1  ORF type:complete len:155 (+),score=17.82 TRINITY_DN33377_c0_g1_i1:79-543(+)